MKLLITTLIVIVSFNVFGQDDIYYSPDATQVAFERNKWKEIPKGTTQLTVNNVTFKHAVNLLLDNGYELEKYDESIGFITTSPKPLPRSGTHYINIRIKDKKAIVSGLFNTNISIDIGGVRTEPNYWEIEKRGSPNSTFGHAFFQMYSLAEQMGKVQYVSP